MRRQPRFRALVLGVGWGGYAAPPATKETPTRAETPPAATRPAIRGALCPLRAKYRETTPKAPQQDQQRRNIEKQGTRQGWRNIATFIYKGTASTAQKRRAFILSLSLLICLLIYLLYISANIISIHI